MKAKIFLLFTAFAVLLFPGCEAPWMQEENSLPEEKQEEKVTPEAGGAKSFSVSFSIGSENPAGRKTGSNGERASMTVPDYYDQISYFLITISDSEGELVIHREKYEKISWAPGFVVSEPLELPPGDYNLEELILIRADNVVLYATPRTGSLLADVVKKSLPVPFMIANTDLTVYTQVIDVECFFDAIKDPVSYFGYELGVIDEVAPYSLNLQIFDINGDPVSEEITISGGDWQITKTIDAGGTKIFIPNNLESYNVEVTAPDGSGYSGNGSSLYTIHSSVSGYVNFRNSIREMINRGYHSLSILLTSPVDSQFTVMGEDGNSLDVPLLYKPLSPDGYAIEFDNVSGLYSKSIYATNNTEISCSPPGYEPFSQVYTLAELKNSETVPIEILPTPVSTTFSVMINKPVDLIDTTAKVTIVSTGKTTVFNDIPYDTSTPLTFSVASDPVEITVSGDNILPEQKTFTIPELEIHSDTDPLSYHPAVTVTMPFFLNRPVSVTAEGANIHITSNGSTFSFTDVPYETLTPLTISDLTNPVEITVYGTNIATNTYSYTIAQLFSFTTDNPLRLSPVNSFPVALKINKPSGLPHPAVDVRIVSNGSTRTFNNVPYNLVSELTLTDVTSPVEINIFGKNINPIQHTYPLSQLFTFTNSSPLVLFAYSTASFFVTISKPDLITTEVVDLEVVTNGNNTPFTNIPFGTPTPLTISGVSDIIEITVSGANITTFNQDYSLSDINSFDAGHPMRISPANAFTFPAKIYRPLGVPHSSATLTSDSNGNRQHHTVPYNTLTWISLSGVDNTVVLDITGYNIKTIADETYSLTELLAFTDDDPLEYSPINSFGFSVRIHKPAGLPHTHAQVTITSNGHSNTIDVPYDQTTSVNFSDVSTYSQLTVSGDNIISITRSYSTTAILDIAGGSTGREEFTPLSTYTIPFILNQPDGISDLTADVRFISSGTTYRTLQDVPYGTLTSVTLSDIDNSIAIMLSGSEILETTSTFSLQNIIAFDETNPIQLTPLIVPVIALPFSEDFESGAGGWIQDTTDTLEWTLHSGSTSSSSTGPSGACTGTYYMYTEASGNNNNTASLISPYIDFDNQTGEYIDMKLHMYGSTMGSITVYYQVCGSSSWIHVGTRNGDHGNMWLDFNNSLDHLSGKARIKISGTIGSSYYSDIAIDDVVIGY